MTAAALWTAAEAAEATQGETTGDWTATGVSIDSRSVSEGDLFVALEGPNFDGHDFIAQALDKGAVAALAHRRPEGLAEDAPLLMVADTFGALQALGRAGRARSDARIAAITGSSGKTSTKEALAACCAAQGETYFSRGSFNNHWGVPLSLARLPKTAAFGVFELGMNHPGEIRELVKQVRPHAAMITNIGLAHIEYFADQTGIADAKAEIFEGLEPGGVAVLPRDDAYFDRLAEKAMAAGAGRVISFGASEGSDVLLVDCSLHATCSALEVRIGKQTFDFCLAQPGRHWAMNALGVLGMVKALGGDLPTAAAQFAKLQPLAGRGARLAVDLPAGGRFLLIDDAYNANPASVAAAIEVLGRAKVEGDGRRIAVLGDMLELGARAKELHAGLAEPLGAAGVDLVFTCGAAMAALHEALPKPLAAAHRENSSALLPDVLAAVGPGDCVLVKGSLGSRMKVIVEGLQAQCEEPPLAANGG
jgi:UDP-N-acetylmuramoyl-tripeptide--D-alanyl-D-alanine ligase